jgi:hypothetical protein
MVADCTFIAYTTDWMSVCRCRLSFVRTRCSDKERDCADILPRKVAPHLCPRTAKLLASDVCVEIANK